MIAIPAAILVWSVAVLLELADDPSNPLEFIVGAGAWAIALAGLLGLILFLAVCIEDRIRPNRKLAGPANRKRLPQ